MIEKFTVYGERCSGTNFIEVLLLDNFKIDITWKYGWKHFFGFSDLKNSDDTLFICIIRNPYDWSKSLYYNKFHIPYANSINFNNFINNEWYSIYEENDNEILEDRNTHTKKRYNNIS